MLPLFSANVKSWLGRVSIYLADTAVGYTYVIDIEFNQILLIWCWMILKSCHVTIQYHFWAALCRDKLSAISMGDAGLILCVKMFKCLGHFLLKHSLISFKKKQKKNTFYSLKLVFIFCFNFFSIFCIEIIKLLIHSQIVGSPPPIKTL